MHLSAIHMRTARGRRVACDRARLAVGEGLSGAASAGRGDRQVSLLAGESLPGLRTLGGLCTGRFDADLITGGLDYAALRPGVRLRIGSARLEITAQGKRCFDDCPLRLRGERCALPESCAFARVLEGGDVALGDAICVE